MSIVITAWLTLALLEKKSDVYISPFLKPISLLQFFSLLGTVTLDKSKIILTKSGRLAQNSRITLMLDIIVNKIDIIHNIMLALIVAGRKGHVDSVIRDTPSTETESRTPTLRPPKSSLNMKLVSNSGVK